MQPEWADDIGRREVVEARCDRPNNRDDNGCGWQGSVIAMTQYGITRFQPSECPRCDGPIVEVGDAGQGS